MSLSREKRMKTKLEAVEIVALALCLTLVSSSAIASAGFSTEEPPVIDKSFTMEEPRLMVLIEEAHAVDVADAAAIEELLGVGVKIPAVQEPAAEKPGQFSEQDLIDVLKSVGFKGGALKEAWAVAMKESTGRPTAHNDNPSTGDNSYGLFQINMRGSMGPDRAEKYGLASYEDLFDPYINATIAYQMSKGGKNWGPWGIGPDAYNGGTTGSYYKWLEQYPGE
jgi:hypothetical protein